MDTANTTEIKKAPSPYIYKTNFRKRILATIFDYGLFCLICWLYIIEFGEQRDDGIRSVYNVMTLPIAIYWFLYFILLEAVLSASIGHWLFNLKVLTLDRKKINLRHSARRHCVDIIDIFFYGIPAIIIIKNTDKHQRLGDLLAKTIVVDTKDPEQYF